ncbi:MAG: hypothetical protein ACI93G_001716, partial [Hyphomonas sp.]
RYFRSGDKATRPTCLNVKAAFGRLISRSCMAKNGISNTLEKTG